MKLSAILLVGFAIFAAPCAYDFTSSEPSALAAFFTHQPANPLR